MNLSALSDASLQDASGLQQFLDLNAMDHEVIFAAFMEQQSSAPAHYVLWREGDINEDWLDSHEREHAQLAQSLGLPGIVGLDTLDVKDAAQSSDWLKLHADAHQLLIEALAL